jgi:hypothetical protein
MNNYYAPYRVPGLILLLTLLSLCPLSRDAHAEFRTGGHVKYFYSYTSFPGDASSLLPDPYRESLGNIRLKTEYQEGNWNAQVHYVLNGIYSAGLNDCLMRGGFTAENCTQLASDSEQLLDLSSVISDRSDTFIFHRLDRLVLSYSTDAFVARAGRQSISWGNGMVYNPLDLFNPFPPDAIDTEYKSGDDMLYMQALFNTGNDLQLLMVPRREQGDGKVSSSESALAAKFHGFGTAYEIDLLGAINYDDEVIGAALTTEISENVLNMSATLTHTDNDNYLSAIANYNFSSIIANHNLSGFVELFYNGFGLSGDEHSLEDVRKRRVLADRLERGELFTIGRYYLAAGGNIEMNPLFNLTPTLFVNLGDQSALLQFSGTYNLKQDLDLLAGFNLPWGSDGSEYGGLYISDASDDQLLAPGITLFARLALYF